MLEFHQSTSQILQGGENGIRLTQYKVGTRYQPRSDSKPSRSRRESRSRPQVNQNQQPWETRPPHQQHPPAVGNAKSPTRSGSNLERRSAVAAQRPRRHETSASSSRERVSRDEESSRVESSGRWTQSSCYVGWELVLLNCLLPL